MARTKTAGGGAEAPAGEDVLKEAEKVKRQLSSILEQSPAIILITDTEGNIEYANRKFTDTSGYALSEVLGKSVSIVKSGKTAREQYAALWTAILDGKVWNGAFCNRKKDGSEYWVYASICPIMNSRGEITNFIAVEEDFTARKKAEEALAEQQKKTEELAQAKDIFIQNITHELKTPLSVILGNISLLRGIAPPETAQEWSRMLDMAERNAVRLRRSIDQILQLGKLDTSELKREPVQLDRLLQDIYLEHLAMSNMKGIDFNISLEKAEISADRELLRLAIANFISNAIKFTEKGEVQLTLKAGEKDVEIAVTDSGIGISAENQKKLFQKFFKADPNAPGSGIGLALSATIIAKHKGTVGVESELGKGSTFRITVPRGE
jgi:PAS domain S-box-containing protein